MESEPIRLTRRALLRHTGMGLGGAALSCLLGEGAARSAVRRISDAPHHPARARNVIFLHMVGAPSQLDLWEDKPALQRLDGELAPKSLVEGERFAFLRGHPKMIASPYEFARHGESGMVFSELLPHMATIADEFTMIRSLHTEQFNPGPAQLVMHTGFPRFG